jgi:hypothetical protein
VNVHPLIFRLDPPHAGGRIDGGGGGVPSYVVNCSRFYHPHPDKISRDTEIKREYGVSSIATNLKNGRQEKR